MKATRHLVDQETLPLLDFLPPLILTRASLDEIRRGGLAMAAEQATRQLEDVQVVEHFVPGYSGDESGQPVGQAPDIRVLVYTPQREVTAMPAILHIHGGGMVMGSPEMNHGRNLELASELGCVVASVDYRLAPETPYPGPLNDCYGVFLWLQGQADSLGIDLQRIAVLGESAGGGLAAALCLKARDLCQALPAFQALLYPMIDDRTGLADCQNTHAGEFIWTTQTNAFGWSALLGEAYGTDAVHHQAAPARATDYSSLPPTWIAVGSIDLFVDEDIAYANNLIRAGVPTELHVYPGAPHGFELLAETSLARQYRRDLESALKRGLNIN